MGERLQELDPESRALLELSLLRGVADEELAQLLGVGEERVRERRDAVFSELGAESEQERASVAALLRKGDAGAQAARPEAEAEPGAEAEAEPKPEAEPGTDAEAEPKPKPEVEAEPDAEIEPLPPERARSRRRALQVALLGGLAIAVAAALALDEDEPGTVPAASGPRAEPTLDPLPRGSEEAELRPLGGGGARGSVKIVGAPDDRRVRLVVRGLPDPASGGYVVWLYDSISDARPLTGARRGSFAIQEPLPRLATRYRFLDVSREPADGNPNHSGESVLRARLP